LTDNKPIANALEFERRKFSTTYVNSRVNVTDRPTKKKIFDIRMAEIHRWIFYLFTSIAWQQKVKLSNETRMAEKCSQAIFQSAL